MKKEFRKLKCGDYFTYRSALYLKIGLLQVCKLSKKYCKRSVTLSRTSRGTLWFGDINIRSLVTPVKVTIHIRRK